MFIPPTLSNQVLGQHTSTIRWVKQVGSINCVPPITILSPSDRQLNGGHRLAGKYIVEFNSLTRESSLAIHWAEPIPAAMEFSFGPADALPGRVKFQRLTPSTLAPGRGRHTRRTRVASNSSAASQEDLHWVSASSAGSSPTTPGPLPRIRHRCCLVLSPEFLFSRLGDFPPVPPGSAGSIEMPECLTWYGRLYQHL